MTDAASTGGGAVALRVGKTAWLTAVVRTSRPRQWPKNLLVFAAPLAGASMGRNDGLAYASAAFAAFVAASSAVYLVNDVVDAHNDRLHPRKRYRPVAAGQLPRRQALVVAAVLAAAAESVGLLISEPGLSLVVAAYLALSFLYSAVLKHVPVIELAFVASGFVLRAVGGAIATHVRPSGWFLLVCSLGALLVATAKRYCELRVLGCRVAGHRPVMSWYSATGLRIGQHATAVAMVSAYVFWALSSDGAWTRGWHIASALPLAAALARFERLTSRGTDKPVEDLIMRDVPMLCCEVLWLALFVIGL